MKPKQDTFQNYLATHRDALATLLSGIPGATDLYNGEYAKAALLLLRDTVVFFGLSTTPVMLYLLGTALRKATLPAPAWADAYFTPAFVVLFVVLPLAFVALSLKLPPSTQTRLVALAHHLAPAPLRPRKKS